MCLSKTVPRPAQAKALSRASLETVRDIPPKGAPDRPSLEKKHKR